MSLASDADIKQLLLNEELVILPEPNDKQIQPASVDVHLSQYFVRFSSRYDIIDPAEEQPGLALPEIVQPGGVFPLHPGEFALGSIIQYVELGPSVAAQLDGRSSAGRLGILVHATAGWGDPGFKGHITLELKNLHDDKTIWLYPGMRLAQLLFFTTTTPADRPYGSAGHKSSYQHQSREPQPSAMHRNWELMPTEGDQ